MRRPEGYDEAYKNGARIRLRGTSESYSFAHVLQVTSTFAGVATGADCSTLREKTCAIAAIATILKLRVPRTFSHILGIRREVIPSGPIESPRSFASDTMSSLPVDLGVFVAPHV